MKSAFEVFLKDITTDPKQYSFVLTDGFFAKKENSEIQGGNVEVLVVAQKKAEAFEFYFEIDGFVQVVCDRCLETMDLPVSASDSIIVKQGEQTDEDVVFISPIDETFDLEWVLYETVVLQIPIQHFHKEGECDEEMMKKLNACSATKFTEEENKTTDPRWEKLKDILNNN